MGSWDEHGEKTGGFYDCNIYKEEIQNKGEKEKEEEKSRIQMKKYDFYSNRYIQHLLSIKYSNKLRQIK